MRGAEKPGGDAMPCLCADEPLPGRGAGGKAHVGVISASCLAKRTSGCRGEQPEGRRCRDRFEEGSCTAVKRRLAQEGRDDCRSYACPVGDPAPWMCRTLVAAAAAAGFATRDGGRVPRLLHRLVRDRR